MVLAVYKQQSKQKDESSPKACLKMSQQQENEQTSMLSAELLDLTQDMQQASTASQQQQQQQITKPIKMQSKSSKTTGKGRFGAIATAVIAPKKAYVRFDDYLDLNEDNMRRSCKRLMRHLYTNATETNLQDGATPTWTVSGLLSADSEIPLQDSLCSLSSLEHACRHNPQSAIADQLDTDQQTTLNTNNNNNSGKSYLRSQYERRQQRQLDLMQQQVDKCLSDTSSGATTTKPDVSDKDKQRAATTSQAVAQSHELSKRRFFEALARESRAKCDERRSVHLPADTTTATTMAAKNAEKTNRQQLNDDEQESKQRKQTDELLLQVYQSMLHRRRHTHHELTVAAKIAQSSTILHQPHPFSSSPSPSPNTILDTSALSEAQRSEFEISVEPSDELGDCCARADSRAAAELTVLEPGDTTDADSGAGSDEPVTNKAILRADQIQASSDSIAATQSAATNSDANPTISADHGFEEQENQQQQQQQQQLRAVTAITELARQMRISATTGDTATDDDDDDEDKAVTSCLLALHLQPQQQRQLNADKSSNTTTTKTTNANRLTNTNSACGQSEDARSSCSSSGIGASSSSASSDSTSASMQRPSALQLFAADSERLARIVDNLQYAPLGLPAVADFDADDCRYENLRCGANVQYACNANFVSRAPTPRSQQTAPAKAVIGERPSSECSSASSSSHSGGFGAHRLPVSVPLSTASAVATPGQQHHEAANSGSLLRKFSSFMSKAFSSPTSADKLKADVASVVSATSAVGVAPLQQLTVESNTADLYATGYAVVKRRDERHSHGRCVKTVARDVAAQGDRYEPEVSAADLVVLPPKKTSAKIAVRSQSHHQHRSQRQQRPQSCRLRRRNQRVESGNVRQRRAHSSDSGESYQSSTVSSSSTLLSAATSSVSCASCELRRRARATRRYRRHNQQTPILACDSQSKSAPSLNQATKATKADSLYYCSLGPVALAAGTRQLKASDKYQTPASLNCLYQSVNLAKATATTNQNRHSKSARALIKSATVSSKHQSKQSLPKRNHSNNNISAKNAANKSSSKSLRDSAATVWGQIIKICKSDKSQVIELQRISAQTSWGFFVAHGAINNVKGVFISRMHDEQAARSLSGLLSIGDQIISIDNKPLPVVIGVQSSQKSQSHEDIQHVNQMMSAKTKIRIRVKPFEG